MKSQPKSQSLIMVFGLPGTGKTTFARLLSHRLKVRHLNTDIIRSMLGKRGSYDEETKEHIYAELIRQAESRLKTNESVVIDGTFYKASLRSNFNDLAGKYDYNIKWIEICADEEVVKKRVSKKREFSEADYGVYQVIKASFEPMEEEFIQLYSDQEELEEMMTNALKYIKS